MNKRQKNIYQAWYESNALELRDVYGAYSDAKYWAFQACKAWKDTLSGYMGRIITFNKFQFTYGFLTDSCNGDVYFNYMTAHKKERWLVKKGEKH